MGHRFTSTALAALMLGAATPVVAQSADAVRRFDIAASPLESSLNLFARQSGLQILYPSALVAGRRSSGVSGDHAPEAALRALLRETGLTYRRSRPTVFVLVDPSARADADGPEAVELDEVIVTGSYLRGADSPSPVTVLTRAGDADVRHGRTPQTGRRSPRGRSPSRRPAAGRPRTDRRDAWPRGSCSRRG